jgi:lipopolysaccharide/colanic/teichoic acid biosynthesis glycosyltransferase
MPTFLTIGLAIKLTSAGPLFSREKRLGFEEAQFELIRFRTTRTSLPERMEPAAGTALLSDADLTRVGRFLRGFSLDELPQFINVLKGDMSLVGPRPLPAAEGELLEIWHRARHIVRPGITGLWQVQSCWRISFDDMVRLDLRYAKDWSAWRDMKIMIGTVTSVLHAPKRR